MADRRRFLHLCGIAGTSLLAGCTNRTNKNGTPTGSRGTTASKTQTKSPTTILTPTETPTETQTPTATSTETPTETQTPVPGVTTQADKGIPTEGDGGDRFGYSGAVSSDGTTAIIGATGDEDPNGNRAGSAYVFTTSDGSVKQQAKLVPDDGDEGDMFGRSVAVSGDGTTAIIGATGDEDPNGNRAGSAYVFEANDGSWSQQAKLTPDDGNSKDQFGVAVAMSRDGTTAIIGASRDEDPNGSFSGSAYVFDASGGSWSHQAKLAPDHGDTVDQFGLPVALSGDGTTAIIGAAGDEDPNGKFGGSAYVFDASGGSWSQRTKLTPDDGDSEDRFGVSVALSGDGTTAIIGAGGDEDPNGRMAGSAYAYGTNGGPWNQQAKLVPDDGDSQDVFGVLVTVSSDGTTAVIGAGRDEGPNGGKMGSAYLFTL